MDQTERTILSLQAKLGDENAKAKVVLDCFEQASSEYRDEGKPQIADMLDRGVKELPVGSLAKLFDLLDAHPSKEAALEALGAKA
jgi:hypothetical protein